MVGVRADASEVTRAADAFADRMPDAALDALERAADEAAPDIARQFPKITGRAAGGVSAQRVGKTAAVILGGEYTAWRDFGGPAGRRHRMRAVPYRSSGRYALPTIKRIEQNRLAEIGEEAMVDAAKRAGFAVRG